MHYQNMQLKQWCDVPNQSDEFRSQLYVEQHWVFCADQNFEIAFRCCEEATKLAHNNNSAWYTKGLSLRELGRYEEAIAALEQAIAITPKSSPPWYNKACYAALSNQIEESLNCLRKAIELSDTDEYIELAKTDADFDSIRHDPRFQSIITSPSQ